MSDTMPERVWLNPEELIATRDGYQYPDQIPYVPEQRALDAEREREALRQLVAAYEVSEAKGDAQYLALRADLKALLPLARAGLNAYDYALAKEQYGSAIVPVLDRVSIDESLAAVRAILDREGV